MPDGHVRISDLVKIYDPGGEETTAIEGLDLDVSGGEFLSVVGPSGCGKSTLLYLIAGFLAPTRGEIAVDGNPVTGPGTDRGVVFQEYALFPWLTVMENVTFGLKAKGIPASEREEIGTRFIEMMDLEGFENTYPKELSGGMKQRVGLARTLAYDPDILLMDEPFGSLDQPLREALQDHLLDIWSEVEKTVVFITHDVEEAVYLSERVVVMTSRPGKKKTSVEIDLNRSKPREEIVTSEAYTNLKNDIWRDLHQETRTAPGGGD